MDKVGPTSREKQTRHNCYIRFVHKTYKRIQLNTYCTRKGIYSQDNYVLDALVNFSIDCNTVIFSLKTLERSVWEKKSTNTQGTECTWCLSPVSLVYFTLAPDLYPCRMGISMDQRKKYDG